MDTILNNDPAPATRPLQDGANSLNSASANPLHLLNDDERASLMEWTPEDGFGDEDE